jgi:HK97 family phage portal protein
MGKFKDFFNIRKYWPQQPASVSRRVFFRNKNIYVDDDVAMSVAAFNRGVLYIATQMAKLPWEVKNQDNSLDEKSNLNFLLNRRPNDHTNAFNLRVTLMIHAIVAGNGYWEIERDITGRVRNLWHIPSGDVQPTYLSDGSLVYRVTGGSASNSDNGILFLLPRDIFHLRGFHSKDSITGLGAIDYCNNTLAISTGADMFASSLFANGGIPSGIIKVPGKLDLEVQNRMQESWESATSGRKTGSTVVFEEGTDYQPISISPELLQFIEARKFGVPEIARFLGVPPTKLYDLTQSTYSNIEQENLAVANDTLDPWARNLENEADVKLLGRDMKRKTEIDLYEVFRGDMETRSAYYQKMMGIGGMTPNQIRKREGMAPYTDGDKYYIATNNFTPADRVDEVIDAQVKPKSTDESQEKLNQEVANFLKK